MKCWSLVGLSSALLALSAPVLGQSEFVNWETPHVSPLTLTPDGTRLLAVNLPDNRLEVFDVSTGTATALMSIPVGLDPVSVRCRSNTEAWVVNHISDTVSIVDLVAGHVVATLDTDDEPADVVFAGTPELAFVSCSQANTVLVFDPANLAAAPQVIPILGEDPRAMAVNSSGDEVYVAVFESGNRSTVVGGGIVSGGLTFPPQAVNNPGGPYGGQNPPPNSGVDFVPPINPALPTPPPVSMILKQDAADQWMDDNGMNWTLGVSGAPAASVSGRPPGWTLLDHDVAIIATDDLSVTYAEGLMNLCMALGVNPATGDLSVIGTDATNEIRFEPNLTGTFVRSHLALVDPATPGSPSIVDLNPHLDYSAGTLPQATRDMSLADPRGIVWNASGSTAYVTGMGSNNVVVIDSVGARAGAAPTIEVGEGPTGVALDETNDRLYVLNKFEASISVIDTNTELELSRVAFFDPTPSAITAGRVHLYNARETSGLGITACASCHVDARTDRLSWDLGNPAGDMLSVLGNNLGANIPGMNSGFEDFHPMKGPMLTQTLQDIIGKEPLHWRGDQPGLEGFHPAFLGLQGDDVARTTGEMQQFEDFLSTIHFPPNPFREFDNALPTDLPLPGHFTTGDFGPAGQPLPNGNAANGATLFSPPNLLDAPFACATCHTRPTGIGTGMTLNAGVFEDIPLGPEGELHHALVANLGTSNASVKIPQLRNLYERTGFNMTQLENVAGFGFLHDGSIDSIERFVAEPSFSLANDQEVADMVAFMLAFSGELEATGSTTDSLEPLGPLSQSTHAAVGTQLTLSGSPDAGQTALLDAMTLEADQGDVGLVAKGLVSGTPRGWSYLGGDVYQSDDDAATHSRAQLLAFAGAGTELTFTVVPFGSQTRIGIDRDLDGIFDFNELFPNPPVAAFSGVPLTGEAPLTVDFADASTGTISSWAWDFGDGGTSTQESPSYTFTTAGTYTISLTTTGPAGSDTLTEVDYVVVDPASPPSAAFSGTPLSGELPLTVDFTDASTGSVTSWAWDFGDGGTSTEQNPSYTYNALGTYTVSLTVTGPAGSDTLTEVDFVLVDPASPPVAGFSAAPTSGNGPLTVVFSDTTTGAVTSWAWDFGDGGTSTDQNPVYTYTTPGTYTVSLTATGPGGSDTSTVVDFVDVIDAGPSADFTGTPLTGDAPLTVQFTFAGPGQISAGEVTSGSYDYGDGVTSNNNPNPSHTYTTPGTYTVSCTVSGPGGTDTVTRVDYVTVNDPAAPVALFTGAPRTGLAPLTVDFTDASTGTVTAWDWSFGDGGTSTAQNPSYTYATAGTYTVSLTITGPSGTDTLTEVDYVVVDAPVPPTASFSGAPLTGDAPLAVAFANTSTGTISSWAWDFGDGGTSTEESPSYTYVTPGTFTVSLTATGPAGSDTSTQVDYVVVDAPVAPVAAFSGSPLTGEAPLTVGFTDASTAATSWAWTFGDGGTSSAQNPSYTYVTPGTYTVSLTVTGPGGSDTLTEVDYVVVDAPVVPVAAFSGTPVSGVSPLDVVFTDASTGSITSWSWTFGDGVTSTSQNPSHTYASPGTYTVSLTVSGPAGSDTLTEVDYVNVAVPPPVAGFTATPLTGSAPLTVQFTFTNPGQIGQGLITSGSYDYGDGNGSVNRPNPSHTYTTPGTYTVSVTVSGPGGTDTMTRVDYIVVTAP